MEGEGDEIKSKQVYKRDRTLLLMTKDITLSTNMYLNFITRVQLSRDIMCEKCELSSPHSAIW